MRIFGFPLQIRPGFLVFLLLVVLLNGVPLGAWLAGSVAVFTLAHEVGHALAARRTGADARIALDFLAGYATFTPTRALTRTERARIALAGPLTQIVLGVVVLLALGVNPLEHDDFAREAHSLAIWWAGPVIGLLNLVPVLPLDGGNVAAEIVDVARPGRGREIMLRLSPPFTAVAFVLMLASADLRPLASFAAILFIIQLQMVQTRPRASLADDMRLVADAEASAWHTGRPGLVPPGRSMSPWWEAARSLRAGNDDAAHRVIMDDLVDRSGRARRWWPPHAARPDQLAPVVDSLPRPLPEPQPAWPEQSLATLVWALRHTGRFDEGAEYGARAYRVAPSSVIAVHVAACHAALGRAGTAIQWLLVAGGGDGDRSTDALVVHAVRNDAEFADLRNHPEVRSLVDSLSRPRPA